MPLNTTSFLVSQGWEGVGVPLDGKSGKGLKKPLAITQKKTLSGIGKDRDRADDWWNSIFTAGAKSLSIGPSPATSGASTPTAEKAATNWNMGERSAGTATMSLSSLAKREHARKTLMSNFVRGKPIVPAGEDIEVPKPPKHVEAVKKEEVVAASDAEVEATLGVASSSKGQNEGNSKKSDEDRLARKLAKKTLKAKLGDAAEGSHPIKAEKKKSRKDKSDQGKEKKEKRENRDKKVKKAAKTIEVEQDATSKKRKRSTDDDSDNKARKDKKEKKEKKDKKGGKDKKQTKEKKERKDKKSKKASKDDTVTASA